MNCCSRKKSDADAVASDVERVLHGLTVVPAGGGLGPAPGLISGSGTHYQLDGPETGALTVLISGLGDFSYRWERMAPALIAAGRRVLRYDQFGKGWSKAPLGFRYDANAHDAQLHTLLEEIGLGQRPITLVAHSMGGIIAATYATRRPERVHEMVLLAPAGAMADPVPGFRVVQWLAGVLTPVVAMATDGPPPVGSTPGVVGDYTGPDATIYHHEWDGRWIAASRRMHTNHAFAASVARMPFTTLGTFLRAERRDGLGSRTLRVLLLSGKADTIVRHIDEAVWREAFATAAEFRVESPLEGGHGFHIEHAEATKLILDFLSQS